MMFAKVRTDALPGVDLAIQRGQRLAPSLHHYKTSNASRRPYVWKLEYGGQNGQDAEVPLSKVSGRLVAARTMPSGYQSPSQKLV